MIRLENEKTENRKPALKVAAAVILRKDRILLSRRKNQDSWGGYWEFPGGKCRPGEALQDCVKREVVEELGVTVEVRRLLWRTEYAYPTRHVQLWFFVCEWMKGDPQALGCADWKLFLPVEIEELKFPPANMPLVRWLSRISIQELQAGDLAPPDSF